MPIARNICLYVNEDRQKRMSGPRTLKLKYEQQSKFNEMCCHQILKTSFKIFFFVDSNTEFRVDNKLCLFVTSSKLFLFLTIFSNLGVRCSGIILQHRVVK